MPRRGAGPALSSATVEYFSTGACWTLAYELMLHTGGTAVMFATAEGLTRRPGPTGLHAAVLLPTGELLDVRGLRPPAELLEEWGVRAGEPLTLLPAPLPPLHSLWLRRPKRLTASTRRNLLRSIHD